MTAVHYNNVMSPPDLAEEQLHRLEKLLELTERVHSTLHLDRALEIVLDAAIELSKMQRGFIMLYNEERELEFRTGRDAQGTTLTRDQFQVSHTVIQKAVDQQDLFYFVSPSQLSSKSVTNLQIGSGFCMPLFAYRTIGTDRKMIGILYVDSKKLTRFGKEEEGIVKALATQAGLALENATLYELATLDGLTRIYQRRYFVAMAELEWKRVIRHQHPLSILMIDLDHFKQVNDSYGHDRGDLILRKTSQALKQACREEDIVARFGGEEFIILLPETDLEGTHSVVQRIHDGVQRIYVIPDRCITVSIGVASYPATRVNDILELVKFADQALYQAKNAGRNRTVYHSPKIVEDQ
jgi:diguanylate cyclase (GGDEF)-like protein